MRRGRAAGTAAHLDWDTWAGWLVIVAFAAIPRPAFAQEERLELMSEPTSFVDVIDAFDDHDVFDVNISLAYIHTWELGRIQRERAVDMAGIMTRNWENVADYSRDVNTLMIGLDIGIFRDLALYGRLPLILSDDRSLNFVDGGPSVVTDRSPAANPIFEVPFRSPTRSGIDWIGVGLAWSILNQTRDRNVPTWMVMLEGRLAVGDPMRACAQTGGSIRCNGYVEDTAMQPVLGGNAGVGRGTNALRVETRASYRYEYIEPYFGLAFQIEWPGSSDSIFVPGGNLSGYINEIPPLFGRLTGGMAIMPWEDRQNFQRFSVDVRFYGDYLSEGHDYSPLFDALGSSTNPYLRAPVYEGVPDTNPDNGGGADPDAGLRQASFYGLTDTAAHVRIGGQLTLEMQVARYVRFNVSTMFLHSPSYLITQADACNPNGNSGGDMRLVGTCRSGILNPHHRPVIDLSGQRFRMESQTQVDFTVGATAQF